MEFFKKIYTRREFLNLYLVKDPKTRFERQSNALSRELAEKIYFKRMSALVLEDNQLFNKEMLEGDFIQIYTYQQLDEVITGRNTDPVYTLLVEDEEFVTTYFVKYPYFAKRELLNYDGGEDEDAEVDKYGYPVKKQD